MIVTPQSVEKRLLDLSTEIDDVQKFLSEAEVEYYEAKSSCEIAMARERIEIGKSGLKFTVQEKEDLAISICADFIVRLAQCEAKVRAARGNANRVRTQVDIARSVGTSVRSALDI
jgi:hypothetical protein